MMEGKDSLRYEPGTEGLETLTTRPCTTPPLVMIFGSHVNKNNLLNAVMIWYMDKYLQALSL